MPPHGPPPKLAPLQITRPAAARRARAGPQLRPSAPPADRRASLRRAQPDAAARTAQTCPSPNHSSRRRPPPPTTSVPGPQLRQSALPARPPSFPAAARAARRSRAVREWWRPLLLLLLCCWCCAAAAVLLLLPRPCWRQGKARAGHSEALAPRGGGGVWVCGLRGPRGCCLCLRDRVLHASRARGPRAAAGRCGQPGGGRGGRGGAEAASAKGEGKAFAAAAAARLRDCTGQGAAAEAAAGRCCGDGCGCGGCGCGGCGVGAPALPRRREGQAAVAGANSSARQGQGRGTLTAKSALGRGGRVRPLQLRPLLRQLPLLRRRRHAASSSLPLFPPGQAGWASPARRRRT
jgi:hypothetical protein